MKRIAIIKASNLYPNIGAGATLRGCSYDKDNWINEVLFGKRWKKSGWDKVFILAEDGTAMQKLPDGRQIATMADDADVYRQALDWAVAALNADTDGGILFAPVSNHGTHFNDWLTGDNVSCVVCHYSTWSKPRSFMSKLDYKRAYDKITNPKTRVFSVYDSCESGGIGAGFKIVGDDEEVVLNRWIEPPVSLGLGKAIPVAPAKPKQCWTMAGCSEFGTCADIGGPPPYGLLSRTIIDAENGAQWTLKGTPLRTYLTNKMSKTQVPVFNGPEWSFLQEK